MYVGGSDHCLSLICRIFVHNAEDRCLLCDLHISPARTRESTDFRNLYYSHDETNRCTTNQSTPHEITSSKSQPERQMERPRVLVGKFFHDRVRLTPTPRSANQVKHINKFKYMKRDSAHLLNGDNKSCSATTQRRS
jgi:hypothetical protein